MNKKNATGTRTDCESRVLIVSSDQNSLAMGKAAGSMNRRRAKKENEEGKHRFKPSETCPISVNRQEGQREVYEILVRCAERIFSKG